MAVEIERKFLVDDSQLPTLQGGVELCQGYIAETGEVAVRVRLAAERAWLTIKGSGNGLSRPEFEYAIPRLDAEAMLDQLAGGSLVRKTRYRLPHGGMIWEVDVFAAANTGLVIAEIELNSEQQAFERPVWATREVTDDPRYLNVNLARHPFEQWRVTQ